MLPAKIALPCKSGGAWPGFEITSGVFYKTVLQEKWDKGKSIIRDLADHCKDLQAPPTLNHKDLERKRGFFCLLVHDLS